MYNIIVFTICLGSKEREAGERSSLQDISKKTLPIFKSLEIMLKELAMALCHGTFFFRATPMAYGCSQAKGWNHSYSCQPTPQLLALGDP